MSTLIRCDVCKSKKVIMGIGCFEVNCYNCNGVGFIDQKDEEINDNDLNNSIDNCHEQDSLKIENVSNDEVISRVKRKYTKRKH